MTDELMRLTREWRMLYEARTASPDDAEIAKEEHRAWIEMRLVEVAMM